MPKHSKEQILAAMVGVVNDTPPRDIEMGQAVRKYFELNEEMLGKIFMDDLEGSLKRGDSHGEAIRNVVANTTMVAIILGMEAQRRLHEIDELEAIEKKT